jgi:hypothetical protein
MVPVRTILFTLLAATGISPLASGQILTSATLSGIVVDSHKFVVPGAAIFVVREPTVPASSKFITVPLRSARDSRRQSQNVRSPRRSCSGNGKGR